MLTTSACATTHWSSMTSSGRAGGRADGRVATHGRFLFVSKLFEASYFQDSSTTTLHAFSLHATALKHSARSTPCFMTSYMIDDPHAHKYEMKLHFAKKRVQCAFFAPRRACRHKSNLSLSGASPEPLALVPNHDQAVASDQSEYAREA